LIRRPLADTNLQCPREADFLGDRNRLQVEKWNSSPLDRVARTIHDVIEETASRIPDEEAVCSWDGSFTYRQLFEQATRVAEHLIALGVGAEVIVPLCFDKEKWNVVAMLGVLIAGAACTYSRLVFRGHLLTSQQSSHLTRLLRRSELNISSTQSMPRCYSVLGVTLPRSMERLRLSSLLITTLSSLSSLH